MLRKIIEKIILLLKLKMELIIILVAIFGKDFFKVTKL